MATLYTDVSAVQNAPTFATLLDPSGPGNRIVLAVATYTMVGTEAQNDIINVIRLKEGQQVVAQLCRMSGNGIGATGAVQIGDDDDTVSVQVARYSAAITATSTTLDAAFTGGLTYLAPYSVGKDCWLTAKLSTLTTPVAARKLIFFIVIKATS